MQEMEALINQRMFELDSAQEDEENLGAFADLLRTATQIAFYRAAELIDENNRKLSEQFASLVPGGGNEV